MEGCFPIKSQTFATVITFYGEVNVKKEKTKKKNLPEQFFLIRFKIIKFNVSYNVSN